MLLYMAARAQLVAELIRPALEAGNIVVADRYLLANVVYQGYGGGLDVQTLWEVGRVATGGLLPELTIVLDLPAEVAATRINRDPDRMEMQGLEFHARVREGFLTEARRQPGRIVVVDASRPIEVVQADVRVAAQRVMHKIAYEESTRGGGEFHHDLARHRRTRQRSGKAPPGRGAEPAGEQLSVLRSGGGGQTQLRAAFRPGPVVPIAAGGGPRSVQYLPELCDGPGRHASRYRESSPSRRTRRPCRSSFF